MTEDSYSGSRSNPLSQNRYAYVHNNPVNYTDPSGHFRKMLPDGEGPRYTQPKPLINPKDGTLYAPTTPEHEAHQIRQQQTGVYSYTYVPSHVPTSSAYEYIQQQESQLRAQAHAQAVQYRQQQIQQEYAQSIGQYGRPKAREANNLLLNWGKALKDMFTHVCDPKTTKAKDTKGKSPSQKQLQAITKSATDTNYAVNLGGVASWSGTSSASNQPQTSSKKGHTFDLSRLKTISSGNIQALAGLSGLAVGLSGGGPVAGFAVYGAVSSGLTSYSNDDKPLDVAMNTVGGGLQGYFIGKYVQGLYTAAKGAIAGVGMTLTQPKQADKPYGPEQYSGQLRPLEVSELEPKSKIDFYVKPDGTTLPATGYRYMDSKYVDQTMESMQAPGGYIGFSKFDSAKQVQNAYQISPDWSDAKLRGEFDTLQIFDNVRVPKAYGDKAGEILEPLTKVYPEFGTGLDYLRARYYDSRACTFLTEDSYSGSRSNPLSQNRYAYVHNNPVNYTDPSGILDSCGR